ncbi:hypothetical protein C5167_042602 [Papaver somniferum]|uniref:Sucrose synthase N-terminal domain-containing protein n=1 Tax=Papaver somniferum TaxID=3469 RepID=A0A4Y7L4B6_PAPSO|nr:uncharacterized protein LOC113318348 [Papaver somniferum]RZC80026.1 hypothetical protein C5167_042602 [Papaver somniferum]
MKTLSRILLGFRPLCCRRKSSLQHCSGYKTQQKANRWCNWRSFTICAGSYHLPPWVALAARPRLGVWHYIHGNVDAMATEVLTASEYVQFRKELVNRRANGTSCLSWTLCRSMLNLLVPHYQNPLAMV